MMMDWDQFELFEIQAGSLNILSDQLTQEQASQYPYNCIGMLHNENNIQPNVIGTAFLIAENFIVTAKHNLKNAIKLTFYPGVSGTFQRRQGYEVADYRNVLTQGNRGDYALLRLKRSVKRSAYIQLGIDYIKKDQQVGVVGYRADKTQIINDKTLFSCQYSHWKAKSHEVISDSIEHILSTGKGTSGAPLLVKRDSKFYAIAIHLGSYNKNNKKLALMTTKQVYLDFLKWERQMKPSKIKFHLMTDNTQFVALIKQKMEAFYQNLKISLKALQKLKTNAIKKKNQAGSNNKQILMPQRFQTPVKGKKPLFDQAPLTPVLLKNMLTKKQQKMYMKISESTISEIVQKIDLISQHQKQQITSLELTSFVIITLLRVRSKQSRSIFWTMKCITRIIQEFIAPSNQQNNKHQKNGSKDLNKLPPSDKAHTNYKQIFAKKQHLQEFKNSQYTYQQSRKIFLIYKQLANRIGQFINLKKISMHFSFPLYNWVEFHALKNAINQVGVVAVTIDGKYQELSQQGNWAQQWTKIKDPLKTVTWKKI